MKSLFANSCRSSITKISAFASRGTHFSPLPRYTRYAFRHADVISLKPRARNDVYKAWFTAYFTRYVHIPRYFTTVTGLLSEHRGGSLKSKANIKPAFTMAAVSFRTERMAVVIGGGESLTGVASVRYCRLENGNFLLLFYDPSWYGNRKKNRQRRIY